MTLVVVLVGSYVLGSIPFSFLLAKWGAGVDLRTVGSGNIGATNASRVLGWKGGVLGLLLDGAKGSAAVWGSTRLPEWDVWVFPPEELRALAAAAVIAGHLFPIFLKGRGGKGVATSAGVFTVLTPLPMAIAAGIFSGFFALTRYVSVSSILAAIALPVGMWYLEAPGLYQWVGRVAVVAVIAMHGPNLKRLWQGTEPKFSGKKVKPNE